MLFVGDPVELWERALGPAGVKHVNIVFTYRYNLIHITEPLLLFARIIISKWIFYYIQRMVNDDVVVGEPSIKKVIGGRIKRYCSRDDETRTRNSRKGEWPHKG